VIGRRGADEIHSLTFGDPAKPLYVFIGMPHAEDEWVPSLGSLSFAELLSRERLRPDVKSRLDRFSVKIYPLLHPATYESPLFEPGKGERDVLDREKTKNDCASASRSSTRAETCRCPRAGRRSASRSGSRSGAKEDFAGRHVWWNHLHGKFGPTHWESTAPVAEMPPSWSAYWWQDGKDLLLSGSIRTTWSLPRRRCTSWSRTSFGLMPERFTRPTTTTPPPDVLEHSSVATLLLTDQTPTGACRSCSPTTAATIETPSGSPSRK
jgi:hypothetical protein